MESSEIDLSDFQDADDGTNVPADNVEPPEVPDLASPLQGQGGFFIMSKIAFFFRMFFILF